MNYTVNANPAVKKILDTVKSHSLGNGEYTRNTDARTLQTFCTPWAHSNATK